MQELDTLKKHHQEFQTILKEIRHLLDENEVESAAGEVMDLIYTLNAELMVHLTMEDRYIYPILMENENLQIKNRAREFKNEIGGLFGEFQTYRLKWPNAEKVVLDSHDFLADTETIFSIINKRMAMEDELLYPEVLAMQPA